MSVTVAQLAMAFSGCAPNALPSRPRNHPPLAMLVLHTNPQSRGRIARWMLEETEAPYNVSAVRYGPQMKSEEFLALNPMGKVPVLVHDGRVVTETAAICAYLADAFPAAGLAPPLADRHDYYRWLFFTAGPVEAAVTNRALGVEVPEGKQGMVGYGSMPLVVQALEHALARGPYICGEQFTAADVYIGAQVGWGLQFGTLDQRPAFVSYVEKLHARPAHQRASAADDALKAELG